MSVEKDIKSQEEIDFEGRWGVKTDEVYMIALQFYKEKKGSKALTLSYNDTLKLLALTKQVLHGKYNADLVPDNGLFDVIGNNRRRVWESLGNMSKSTAMMEFVKKIDAICPLFAPVVEAHKIEKEERERKMKAEQEELELITRAKQQEELRKQQELLEKQTAQEMLIKNALKQQTYNQFLSYAQLQHPNDTSQQEALICQLQEQHFLQYMQQVYSQQQQQHPNSKEQLNHTQDHNTQQKVSPPPNALCLLGDNLSVLTSNGTIVSRKNQVKNDESEEDKNVHGNEGDEGNTSVANHSGMDSASMWTRKDIQSFKESLKAENEAVIKVGSGELVTVRVPTHENGTSLFWEFATDGLDIGFGLSFEWTQQQDASDGDGTTDEEHSNKETRVDVIVPILRRQSHEEVQCGRHEYPGSGVYLLMFDNSYSMWRSKSIYYRVFYSQ